MCITIHRRFPISGGERPYERCTEPVMAVSSPRWEQQYANDGSGNSPRCDAPIFLKAITARVSPAVLPRSILER